MAFRIDPSVRVKGRTDTASRTFVGYRPPGKTASGQFIVGAYAFSNPISATVFAYLFRKTGVNVAKPVIEEMEKKLDKTGAIASMTGLNTLDMVATAIPVGKYLQLASKAMDTAGAAFIKQQVSADRSVAQYNPYRPATGITWTGTAASEYVDYALAYWKRYKDGPAYILLSDMRGL